MICQVATLSRQGLSTGASVADVMTLIKRTPEQIQLDSDQRDFLNRVLTRTGWSPTVLARKAKLDHSTLSRFLTGGREGHALRHSTIRKIELASGLSFLGALPLDAARPANPEGFAESEATPLSLSDVADPVLAAAMNGRNNVDPWLLRSRALENLGYRPGDTLLVELGAMPRQGDIVCGQVYDWQKGSAETVFRSFQPPYLVAQTGDERLQRPMLVDDSHVVIKGVVTLSYRQRHAA